jgi:hypothetical protein
MLKNRYSKVMTNLSALESTLNAIQATYVKLEEGNISQEELDVLVENSKVLYERAVILRYKAYEEKIFGVREMQITDETEITPETEEIQETVFESPLNSISVEEELEEPIEENSDWNLEIVEQPAFDFSLFDDSSEEVMNEELEENAIEHISVTSTSTEDFGLHEEKIIMEQSTITPVAEENRSFINHFSHIDPSFFTKIGMSKLDSLIGSFGLNERLQFINELFDGSSEAFSEAIKAVDNFPSYHDAIIKVSMYANLYNWDNNSETVEELITKIKRRYA